MACNQLVLTCLDHDCTGTNLPYPRLVQEHTHNIHSSLPCHTSASEGVVTLHNVQLVMDIELHKAITGFSKQDPLPTMAVGVTLFERKKLPFEPPPRVK